jgi:hypothetical protein
MISLIFRRTKSAFRAETLGPKAVIRASFSRAEPRRNFTSSTVILAAMSSDQQNTVPKRAVGKKFVIACDGEFHLISRSSRRDADSSKELGW